jgi:hypothetical protein
MRTATAFILLILCCCGCIQYQKAYYTSPINGLNNAYTTIPLQADSLKSAYYLNSLVSFGSANDLKHDNSFSFQTALSAAHNFCHVQAFYGLGFMLGNYKMNAFDTFSNHQYLIPKILNQYVGKKFFGAIGFSGGANVVGTFPEGSSEVRAGIETSVYKEFGHYLQVRKQLPDSAATTINRNNAYGTIGGHVEFIAKLKNGSVAFNCGLGTVMGHYYHTANGLNYAYCHYCLALTINKWTPYFQANFTTKSNNALIGLNYRLGK